MLYSDTLAFFWSKVELWTSSYGEIADHGGEVDDGIDSMIHVD